MASFNRVILMGNLTRDPEKRYTDGGTCIVNLSVAVNRRIKKQNEWVEEANFFDIVVFGSQAENCAKFLSKGRPVLVEGELRQNRWETPDGQKRSKVEIMAGMVRFLGSRSAAAESSPPTHAVDEEANGQAPPLDDDDIPF